MSHIPGIRKDFSCARAVIGAMLSALLLGTAGKASAGLVYESVTKTIDTMVASGAPVNGTVDASSLLAGRRLVGASVAAVYFDGFDSSSRTRFTGEYELSGTSTSEVPCGPGGVDTCIRTFNSYHRSINTYYVDPLETSVLSIGGQSQTRSSDFFEDIENDYSFFTRNDGPYITNIYETDDTSYRSGHTGGFIADFELDALNLADLLADGMLDFSVTASAGNFHFANFGLHLVFDDTPLPDVVTVPEPASLTLLALGALAASLSRRRAKRKPVPR